MVGATHCFDASYSSLQAFPDSNHLQGCPEGYNIQSCCTSQSWGQVTTLGRTVTLENICHPTGGGGGGNLKVNTRQCEIFVFGPG